MQATRKSKAPKSQDVTILAQDTPFLPQSVAEVVKILHGHGYIVTVPMTPRKLGRRKLWTPACLVGLLVAATGVIRTRPRANLNVIARIIAPRYGDDARTIERQMRKAWQAMGLRTWSDFHRVALKD
ncbi:MAG: hypothetical protein J2P53_02720 [Bradyrhizobiaceae bacterium]|nr:hypothetical protein [Bradyrhizobiaceae bacterium]